MEMKGLNDCLPYKILEKISLVSFTHIYLHPKKSK